MENVAGIDTLVKLRNVSEGVGVNEAEIRRDLAACYRLIAVYGMTDMASNHISARLPGSYDHFLINPYGMLYEEITASSLHVIDLEGNIVQRGRTSYGVNTAGYVIHSAIHEARPDLTCVLHTHTRAGVAVSCLEEGLLPMSQTALQILHDVSYHDFEGPATNEDEKLSLVRDLGDKKLMIMRNHGLMTCGRSIPEAFFLMYMLNTSCQIQLDVLASGRTIHMPSELAVANQSEIMGKIRDVTRGNFEWPALLRKLDRLLPGYAD